MALREADFQNPYWIRYIEGPTLIREYGAEFDQMLYAYGNSREWRIEPQPGYSTSNPSTRIDRVNMLIDNPYIRTR